MEGSSRDNEGPVKLSVEAMRRMFVQAVGGIQGMIKERIDGCKRMNIDGDSGETPVCVAEKTWTLEDAQDALDKSGIVNQLEQFTRMHKFKLGTVRALFRERKGIRMLVVYFTISTV